MINRKMFYGRSTNIFYLSNFSPGDASNHNAEGKAILDVCQQQLWQSTRMSISNSDLQHYRDNQGFSDPVLHIMLVMM